MLGVMNAQTKSYAEYVASSVGARLSVDALYANPLQ